MLAGRVAEGMLAMPPTEDWLGVFALEHTLHVAHGFSRDREAARAALAKVAQRPPVLRDARATLSPSTGVDLDPGTSPTVGPSRLEACQTSKAVSACSWTGAGGAADVSDGDADGRYLRALPRDVQGQMAAVGLRAIAAAMAPLRGQEQSW